MQRSALRARALGSLVLSTALVGLAGGPARAGGYDTPMLYSARHMGMGGTAIAAVDDPSALFHNPAGLGNVRNLSLLGDFSLLLARIKASPNPNARDVQSERTVAPMFLLGAGKRLTDWLVAGVGVYPIASAGATYKYPFLTFNLEDETRLVFLEASPALSVNLLDDHLRFGVGYRLTYVSLERFQGDRSQGQGGTDFSLSGFNTAGLRAGLQWSMPGLSAGVVYRHKVTTTVKNDTGRALSMDFTDVSTEFVLPSKLGFGLRSDAGDFGLAIDVEYLYNSQNKGAPLVGTRTATATSPQATRIEVPNVFEWSNELTLRTGVEYRLLPCPAGGANRLALRLGYVLDETTANPQYPSAFGTPPGPTQVLTGGAGWRVGGLRANVAYAYRFGEGDVTAADSMARQRNCTFCGVNGNEPYRIHVHGLYVDFGWDFD
jgi:hypothetical protein